LVITSNSERETSGAQVIEWMNAWVTVWRLHEMCILRCLDIYNSQI
jgi:hypothetical protein